MGAHLAEIYNYADNMYIKGVAVDKGAHEIWLGADDMIIETKWFWASGQPVDEFTDWAPGQPDTHSSQDENCMELNVRLGHWNDDECYNKQPFICQKPVTSDIIG